jgi:hypothetical protein
MCSEVKPGIEGKEDLRVKPFFLFLIDKSKTKDKIVVSEDLIKKSEPKPTSVSTHTKPTATVQPSPSASLSSISNPSSKRVQSIEEEVKIVKPDARKKAGTVLNRAKHRLDQLWSRNK